MPSRRFYGKIVVITGGAGGIGQACVRKFKNDHQVIILDVNEQAIQDCIEKYDIDGYTVDLSDTESIKVVIQKIVQKYHRIDALVQTAGIMGSCEALKVEPGVFEKMLKVNVEGLFFVMQEVVKQSMKETGGMILNFASEAAIRGFCGDMASVHYSASKGAVIAMSRQLAVEWGAYDINVNSISPGGVLTPAMQQLDFHEDFSATPLKRLSTPEDIAETVFFLCSPQAKMITGQNIIVDGGCAVVGC